jgi:hypothetical protein
LRGLKTINEIGQEFGSNSLFIPAIAFWIWTAHDLTNCMGQNLTLFGDKFFQLHFGSLPWEKASIRRFLDIIVHPPCISNFSGYDLWQHCRAISRYVRQTSLSSWRSKPWAIARKIEPGNCEKTIGCFPTNSVLIPLFVTPPGAASSLIVVPDRWGMQAS